MRKRAHHDSGYTLIELMVTVMIVGVLVATVSIAAPRVKTNSANAAVKGDLRNLSTAAEQHWTEYFRYPTTSSGFAFRNGNETGQPNMAAGTTYIAFVIRSGAKAGYVIFGTSNASKDIFAISSWDEKPPKKVSATALPTVPPTSGYGLPAGITRDMFDPITGVRFASGVAPSKQAGHVINDVYPGSVASTWSGPKVKADTQGLTLTYDAALGGGTYRRTLTGLKVGTKYTVTLTASSRGTRATWSGGPNSPQVLTAAANDTTFKNGPHSAHTQTFTATGTTAPLVVNVESAAGLGVKVVGLVVAETG